MEESDFKRIEALFNRQTVQFQNYLGVVEENFQHKLDLVLEGQQMLAEKLDSTREELKGDIAVLDRRLITVEVKLDGVEGRLDRVEARLEGVEGKLDRAGRTVDSVAADLSAHRADTEAHNGVYCVKED